MEVFSAAGRPGKWAVDSFPIREHRRCLSALQTTDNRTVKYLPTWFPVAWRQYGNYGRKLTTTLLNEPYNDVKERMVCALFLFTLAQCDSSVHLLQKLGNAGISLTSLLLSSDDKDKDKENCIKWSAMSILAGTYIELWNLLFASRLIILVGNTDTVRHFFTPFH